MPDLKCILLVEDDPKDEELTLAALAEHNLANEVVVVRDGEAALNYLHCQGEFAARTNGNPVVVLLDIRMPKVDGIEFLRHTRNSEELKAIPVAIVSGSCERSNIEACFSLGVNTCVVKPLDFDKFMEAMKSLGLSWVVVKKGLDAFWGMVNEPPRGERQKAGVTERAGLDVETAKS